MNNRIIIFLFGTAIGGAGGYFVGKYLEQKKSDEQVRRAEEHYRKRYEARLNEDLKDKIELNPKAEEATDKEVKKAERTAKIPNVEPQYNEIIQKTDYSKYSQVDEEEEIVLKEGPYEVQPGIFDDFLGIDRHELTYFAEDEVVMDSKETVWNDAAEKIGLENLDIDKFGKFEPDIMYIINEDFGEGYKITLDMGSYDEYMSGIEGM